jgi:hypothetical protein
MTQGGAGRAVKKKSSMGLSVCLREGSPIVGYFPCCWAASLATLYLLSRFHLVIVSSGESSLPISLLGVSLIITLHYFTYSPWLLICVSHLSMSYSNPPYPWGIPPKTPSGYLKP